MKIKNTDIAGSAGDAGKVLAVNATEDGVEWIDPPQSYPELASNAGKVLTVNATEDGVEWAAGGGGGGTGVPPGGTTGQTLVKQSATDGDAEWQDPLFNAPGGLVKIAEIVAVGGETLLSINNLPQDFDDLIIEVEGRTNAAAVFDYVMLQFNGDTAANYRRVRLSSEGSANSVASGNDNGAFAAQLVAATGAANHAGSAQIQIPNYSKTTFHKNVTAIANTIYSTSTSQYRGNVFYSKWDNSAAITSLALASSTGAAFVAGTRIAIYARGGKVWNGYSKPAEDGWEVAGTWSFAADGAISQKDFKNLDVYDEILVVMNSVSSAAGCVRKILVSTNNGASFYNAGGTIYNRPNTNGGDDTSANSLDFHLVSSNAGRSGFVHIRNSNKFGSKQADSLSNGYTLINDLNPINAIRVTQDAGTTFTGGSFTVWGRRTVKLVSAKPWYWKPPKASSFTTASGDASALTLTDDPDVGLLATTPRGVTNIVRHAYVTLTDKSLDWDLIVRFNGHLDSFNFSFFGLLLEDSIGGRLHGWVLDNQGPFRVNQIKLNNKNNGYNSSYGSADPRSSFNWFRIKAEGSTIRHYTSSDGKIWQEWGAVAITDFLANRPDRVGFGFVVNRTTGANPLGFSIDHFSLTGPAV